MRPRIVAILALLAGGLVAFIWFFERDLPSSEERSQQARRLLELDTVAVERVVLEHEGERVELARPGEDEEAAADERGPAESRWWLVEPVEAPADDAAVEGLLRTLGDLEKQRSLEGMERRDAGLSPPRGRLILDRGNEQTVLEIGAPIPASTTMLVAVGGRDEVHVVEDGLLDQLRREPGEWRNRRLFPAPRSAVAVVTLERAGSRVVLARRGEDFWIEEPLRDRADEEKVDRLLTELVGFEAASFPDPAASEWGALSGGAGEAVAVEMTDGGGRFRLELGSEAEEGRRYARAGELLVTTRAALAEALERPAEKWRSRTLSSPRMFEVERLEIEDPQGELELERRDGDWYRGEEKIPFSTIDDLLYAVEDARALGFSAPRAEGEQEEKRRLRLRYRDADGAGQTLAIYEPTEDGVPVRVDARDVTLLVAAEALAEIEEALAAVRAAEPRGE